MTTTGRTSACFMMFLALAASDILPAARFTTSVAAREPSTSAKLPPPWKHEVAPPKIDFQRPIRLQGKVFDPRGQPVAGARLYLSADHWTDPVELGTTDVNGAYRCAAPEKQFHQYLDGTVAKEIRASIIAIASNSGPGWAALSGIDHDGWQVMQHEYTHDIHLTADFPIDGRIVDAAGRPVARAVIAVEKIFDLADRDAGAMLAAIKSANPQLRDRAQSDPLYWNSRLRRSAWNMITPIATDADGRFRIAGVGRDRAIQLEVTGAGIQSTSFSVLTRDDVDAFTKAIRTRDPHSSKPNGGFSPPGKSASTGAPDVQVFGPHPTIAVAPSRTVAGIVRDAKTGKPISDARMVVDGMAGKTDRQGRYRIVHGSNASRICVSAEVNQDGTLYPSVMRQIDNTAGAGESIADFDLDPGVSITGRVLESGTDRPIVASPRYSCHAPWPGRVTAGSVTYFPLATNAGLRGTPAGLYFAGGPTRTANYYVSATIGPDGDFRMAVPPGPGVLLVQASPGLPAMGIFGIWKESEGFHRLSPYLTIAGRTQDDGAPGEDPQSFPGLNGPIALGNCHAYRIINPPADEKSIDLTLNIPRAPSRLLRFVGPDGRAIIGARVQGLTALSEMKVVLEGSEVEMLALDPVEPREVIATSPDGKFAARATVGVDDLRPKTIRLTPVKENQTD